MKNTAQVRKKHSIRPASFQEKTDRQVAEDIEVKSPFGPEFDLHKDMKEQWCLCVFSREGQDPACKIPLTEEELENINRIVQKLKINIGDFVADAIREKLAKLGGPGRNELVLYHDEMEAAVRQSKALGWLLLNVAKGPGEGCEWSNDVVTGWGDLVSGNNIRLTLAMEKVCATILPEPAPLI